MILLTNKNMERKKFHADEKIIILQKSGGAMTPTPPRRRDPCKRHLKQNIYIKVTKNKSGVYQEYF